MSILQTYPTAHNKLLEENKETKVCFQATKMSQIKRVFQIMNAKMKYLKTKKYMIPPIN